MQIFEIGMNEAGQRLDKYLGKLMPSAPKSFIYRMLRKKNILLNDRRAEGSEKTQHGDVVKLFLSDSTISQMRGGDQQVQSAGHRFCAPAASSLEILYQDAHVMLVNKPQGMLSQKSQPSDVSMVELIISYLTESGVMNPEQLKTFHPSVVNRLDRNTSGILCAGISLPGLQDFSALFRERTMKKEYLCLVKGCVKGDMHLKGYLLKNHRTNQVEIFSRKPKNPEASYIETVFTPLSVGKASALLCADLITGRSHQIRAHLASIGHPIIGDTKYGDMQLNRRMKNKYGINCQCLHAWRMTFPVLSGALAGLSQKQISAPLPDNFKYVMEGEDLSWPPGREEA